MEQAEVLKKILETNQALVKEMKGLRDDLIGEKSDACNTKTALSILGLTNARLLTYFCDEAKILTRQPGGSSFIYYKEELKLLSKKIKSGDVIVPKIRHLRSTKK